MPAPLDFASGIDVTLSDGGGIVEPTMFMAADCISAGRKTRCVILGPDHRERAKAVLVQGRKNPDEYKFMVRLYNRSFPGPLSPPIRFQIDKGQVNIRAENGDCRVHTTGKLVCKP